MTAELKTVEQPTMNTGLSVFDSGQFEQMGMIASKLAESSLIPQTLKGDTDEQTAANCFRVVEQAQRWGLSPFAVMDAASVVHGKLMWEGKLIAAALNATLGVRLRYEYSGEGEKRKVVVSGEVDGRIETIEGTVADWKTTGKNSPWDKLTNRDQMLAYRGARVWARRHTPEVILGVYAPDEMNSEEMVNVTHGRSAPMVREEPINPGAGVVADKKEETKAPESPEPNPEKTPAQGRQKKDRHHRDCVLKDLTKHKTESNKDFWIVIVDVGQNTAQLRTFSSTLAERLGGIIGTQIRVTFTQGAKGAFDLEDFEVIETPAEGGLI